MSGVSFSPFLPRWRVIVPVAAVALGGLVLLDGSYYTVGQNERAFVRQFGRVVDAGAGPVGPGLHWKQPVGTAVDKLPVSIDVLDTGNIDAFTRDAQKITLHLTLTTQVPDGSVYHLLYEVGRAGNVDLQRNYETVIADRVRTVVGRHDITEVAGADRQAILDEARGVLSHDLAELFGIKVDSVQVALVGMPDSYAAAIEAAMRARTDRQAAEQNQARAQVEAVTAKVRAAGEADAQIEQARGQSQSSLLRAEAEAQATRLRGQADADAARALAQALDANPGLVALRTAERWNGQLPQNIYAGAPLPLVSVPGAAVPGAAGR